MIPSQAERLRALIAEDILSLKLRPGDRLDECGLAEKYGTSRTPVRPFELSPIFGDGLMGQAAANLA